MKPIKITRLYSTEDAYMTETARVTHGLFEADLVKFTDFDTTMTKDYAALFLRTVEDAEKVVADTAIIDQQVTLTDEVDVTMDKARLSYNEIKYFVLKAFPKSIGIQGEFGLNDYERARKSRPQMAQFLEEMRLSCQKYQQELLKVGCSVKKIDLLKTVREELIAKNTIQKIFKKQRPKLTEDRIMVLNACYQMVVQVMAAAQLVFVDDYAKQNQYVFVQTTRSSDKIEFSGEVAPKAVVLVEKIEYNAGATITFRNTGTVSLTFALSKSNEIEGKEVELAGGATISNTLEELNDGADNLLVRNNDSAKAGNYLIEIEY